MTSIYDPSRMGNCGGGCGSGGGTPYQRQQVIQQTVRVPASLYTMNLAGLAGFQSPLARHYQVVEITPGSPYITPPTVCWNQSSDRAKPAIGKVATASGTTYHSSSIRRTITRDRPGAMTPGGVGVDVKHNSYERYLNRLKGKAPLRRGPGGKTGIISGCYCSVMDDLVPLVPLSWPTYQFHVGDRVLQKGTTMSGIVVAIDGTIEVAWDNNPTHPSLTRYEELLIDDTTRRPCSSRAITVLEEMANPNRLTYDLTRDNIFCRLLNGFSSTDIG